MPGSRGEESREVDTRVGFETQTRFISGGASNQVWPSVCRLSSVSFPNTHFIFVAIFCCDPIYSIDVLFDSVPTRFCLGTWQTLLSSPLLVMWKSNPLALGPRLIALLNVVTRVLNQVAQAHQ